MESILTSIKAMLGITEDYTHFDTELIMHINSAFSILAQIGVGPSAGFSIQDSYATWSDFMAQDFRLEMVKTYMYQKVKFMFDPPDRSVIKDVMQKQIEEFEFRLSIAADEVKNDVMAINGTDFMVDWSE